VAKARSGTRPKTTSPADDPVTAYALKVQAGEYPAGPHVRDACARHLRDLAEGPARGLRWDVAAAKRVIGFFADVLVVDKTAADPDEGEGAEATKPFVLLPWQAFIIGSLFGWKKTNGRRRFRMAYVETGKGSGKSPMAAGIGLYMMTADGESRAECYAAATKKDQAKVLFRDAVAMVDKSAALSQRLEMGDALEKHNIAYVKTGSFFRPISTEQQGKGQSGPRPHFAALDEIHEHPTNAMVEFMRAGTKGRRQALIFMITNSGHDRQSVCWDYHDYGAKVCAGQIEDDSFFAYIAALDEKDDPFADESCWAKANPSLGATFTMDYLREQVQQARGMPSKQNIVLRLNFCRWTDAEDAWIGKEQWDACEADIDIRDLEGRTCYGGLDLSGTRDLTAAAFIFPAEDGTFDAFVEFWKPADTLTEAEDIDRVPYRLWRTQGHLRTTPGSTVDYDYVASRLGEISSEFNVERIAFDRWGIKHLQKALDYYGVNVVMEECGQGYKDIDPAVKALESMILNKRLRVKSNPILRWNAASTVLEIDDPGSRKFTKRKATGRIDGIVALAMAAKLATEGGNDGKAQALEAFINGPMRI
jgi:phage terminase large subunit-like protein